MTTWLTSDLHFGHPAILDFCDRPWDSLDAMHEGLIERWNDTVGDGDLVIVLGDICMGDRLKTLGHVTKLRGRKILLPGNHDHCWPGGKRNWAEWADIYRDHGLSIITMVPPVYSVPYVLAADVEVQMAHFPKVGDSGDIDRYQSWRPVTDRWLLHGHVHSKDRIDVANKQVHVGVDAWDYAPVADVTLTEIIRSASASG